MHSISNDDIDSIVSNTPSIYHDSSIIVDNIISLKTLSLYEEHVYDKYKESLMLLGYVGWRVNPTIHHMNSKLSTSEIIRILTIDAELDIPCRNLPQLKKFIPKKISITRYDKQDESNNGKPNLLITLATLFYDIIKKTNNINIDSILSVLGTNINIITQRNSMKMIFSYYFDRKEDWSIYVCQPISNGPIYIERTESYIVNEGTIGNQFERAVTSKGVFNRVYAVTKGLLGDISIAFTGEIDACTHNDQALEIKSKPHWFNKDTDRDLTNFIQSSLSGTNFILTGGFKNDKNDCEGPVVFSKKNILLQTLDEFCESHKNINDEIKNNIYNYGANILTKIKAACETVGVVYEIKSMKDDMNSIHIRQLNRDFDFPINETIIRNTAEAVISIASNTSAVIASTANESITSTAKEPGPFEKQSSRPKFTKRYLKNNQAVTSIASNTSAVIASTAKEAGPFEKQSTRPKFTKRLKNNQSKNCGSQLP